MKPGRNGPTGWQRILVATDFSAPGRIALRSAIALARRSGTEVVLVHVVEPAPQGYESLMEASIAEGRRLLEAAARRARAAGVRSVETRLRVGTPWREVVATAEETEAGLIALGNSGRGRFERLLLGSTAENVVRHSPVPVLLTRSRPLAALRRVLVPVDFDAGSRRALEYAARALPRGARIEAYHAAPALGTAEPWMPVVLPLLPEATAQLRAFVDATPARRAVAYAEICDSPAAGILRRARSSKADLILMSTHGRGGLEHVLLGSVAEKIARYADRPVLVLPPAGREAAGLPASGVPRRAGRKKPPAELVGETRAVSLGRRPRGPWTGQVHTGRGGPAGRRGGTRPRKSL